MTIPRRKLKALVDCGMDDEQSEERPRDSGSWQRNREVGEMELPDYDEESNDPNKESGDNSQAAGSHDWPGESQSPKPRVMLVINEKKAEQAEEVQKEAQERLDSRAGTVAEEPPRVAFGNPAAGFSPVARQVLQPPPTQRTNLLSRQQREDQ